MIEFATEALFILTQVLSTETHTFQIVNAIVVPIEECMKLAVTIQREAVGTNYNAMCLPIIPKEIVH